MTEPPAILLQHKIADLCSRSPDPDVAAFGAALRDGGSLEAFGLAYATERFAGDNARSRRAALLRQLAASHFAVETRRGRASSILSALTDFREKQYRADIANPHDERSRPWLLWELCAVQARLPEPAPSARTIREILHNVPGDQMVFNHKDGAISAGA